MTAAARPGVAIEGPVKALIDLVIVFAEVVLKFAGALLRQPLIAGPLAFFGAAGYLPWSVLGLAGAIVTVTVATLAPLVWRLSHASSFERLVGRHLRNARVRLWTYERRWRQVMKLNGLSRRHESRGGNVSELVPRILRCHAGPFVDRVLVSMLDNQEPDDFAVASGALQNAFDALWVTTRPDRHGRSMLPWRRHREGTVRGGRVWLEFQRVDPLVTPIDALPIPAEPDLSAVQVGLLDSGEPWVIRLLGAHVLLIGATRSGKSSFIHSMLRNIAPLIKSGVVRVWCSDPKGGMELLGPCGELFERSVANDPKALLAMLTDLVAVMEERAERQREAKVREHTPSVEEPFIILILDELIAATIVSEKGMRSKIEGQIRKLQVTAAACGISLLAGAQNPLKEVLGNRDEFTYRVGFRMNASTHPDATYFESARAAGFRNDDPLVIPPSMRGLALFLREGSTERWRGRVAFVPTPLAIELAQDYGPGATPVARVRARLEGRGEGVPLTKEAQAEVDAILATMREADEADAGEAQAGVEGEPEPEPNAGVEPERPRSIA